jgi:hypothetical protein
MAATNLLTFLLNRDKTDTAVSAPAYSITKVLATGASVVTPLVALLAAKVGSVAFSSAEVVVLTVAVLGFLAVVAAADVISRSAAAGHAETAHAEAGHAEAGSRTQQPAVAAAADGLLFEFLPVRKGILHQDGPDPDVQVIAGRGQRLLVAEQGKRLAWVPQEQVTFC